MVSRARVAFVSPSGFGNLGDAAIIDSLIAGIRRRLPDAEIVGFTLNPSDTSARHGVEAGTCGAYSLPHYPIRRAARGPDAPTGEPPPPPSFVRRTVGALPGARRSRDAARFAVAELRHRREIAARIRGFDHVVIAGGGQLDELWGGPFGHPYTLYRWSRAARRAGARFVVLSVGTGTLATRLGRMFVARTLAASAYHSFRDARSRELAVPAGAAPGDPIVPDLAYGLTVPLPPASARVRTRRAIGVAPMCYADPRVWPKPDAARYAHHIASMAEIATRAAATGHDVVLFGTDTPDRDPVAECHARALAALDDAGRARVQRIVPQYTGELMTLLQSLDVVVAARFHGVLLAHVAGKPVLAVSHERKVATLMSELGQDAYCAPIDALDPAAASALIDQLLHDGAIEQAIRAQAADHRRRVEAQYDRVFGSAA